MYNPNKPPYSLVTRELPYTTSDCMLRFSGGTSTSTRACGHAAHTGPRPVRYVTANNEAIISWIGLLFAVCVVCVLVSHTYHIPSVTLTITFIYEHADAYVCFNILCILAYTYTYQ